MIVKIGHKMKQTIFSFVIYYIHDFKSFKFIFFFFFFQLYIEIF